MPKNDDGANRSFATGASISRGAGAPLLGPRALPMPSTYSLGLWVPSGSSQAATSTAWPVASPEASCLPLMAF